MMAWEPSSRTWLKALTCLPGKEKIPEHRAATSNEDTNLWKCDLSGQKQGQGGEGGRRQMGRTVVPGSPAAERTVSGHRPQAPWRPVPAVPKVKTPPERAALCHAQTGTGFQLSVPGSLGPGKQQPPALGEQTSRRGS